MRFLIAGMVCIVFSGIPVLAEDVDWTNAGGDNNWFNPQNWSSGRVPGPDDDVTIPENVPICQFPFTAPPGEPTNVVIRSLENRGEIGLPDSLTVTLAALSAIKNEGLISGDDARILMKAGLIRNSGTIHTGSATFTCGSFENPSGGSVVTENGDIHILSLEEVVNLGAFLAGRAIFIYCLKLENQGEIQAGDGVASEDGGDVLIYAYPASSTSGGVVINAPGGVIRSGNGGPDNGKDGMVEISARKIKNEGRIQSGDSDDRDGQSRITYFGNCSLYADSIDIHGMESSVRCDTLLIAGMTILLDDMSGQPYPGIVAESRIRFNTPAAGIADFSGVHTENAIYISPGDEIGIYSNSIMEPGEGFGYICSDYPRIHPADTTVVNAGIRPTYRADESGTSGAFDIAVWNLSTGTHTVDYSVSSAMGWISPMGGSITGMPPFTTENIPIEYLIPGDTDPGVIDTVTATLSLGPGFSDTSYSIIMSLGASAGVDERITPRSVQMQLQCSPNPLSAMTEIRLSSSGDPAFSERPYIAIHDITGKAVRSFTGCCHSLESRSEITFRWHGLDDAGRRLPSGIYFISLTAGGRDLTRRIVLIR